jgi:hypothetical protein
LNDAVGIETYSVASAASAFGTPRRFDVLAGMSAILSVRASYRPSRLEARVRQ